MRLTAYTQFVSTTEIEVCVYSLSAAKPYLLYSLKEGLRKLQQENSSLGTAGEQGWFWKKNLIFIVQICILAQFHSQLKGEEDK